MKEGCFPNLLRVFMRRCSGRRRNRNTLTHIYIRSQFCPLLFSSKPICQHNILLKVINNNQCFSLFFIFFLCFGLWTLFISWQSYAECLDGWKLGINRTIHTTNRRSEYVYDVGANDEQQSECVFSARWKCSSRNDVLIDDILLLYIFLFSFLCLSFDFWFLRAIANAWDNFHIDAQCNMQKQYSGCIVYGCCCLLSSDLSINIFNWRWFKWKLVHSNNKNQQPRSIRLNRKNQNREYKG